ncbi:MAG: DUF5667 domain-containing protein [Candidatus Paceibacterota bacterium]
MNKHSEQFNTEGKDYKKVTLSSSARERIRGKLFAYADKHPAGSPAIQSPYVHSVFSYRKVFAVSLLILFFITGATTYAAQASLPGDMLYGVKTNFTEPALRLTKVSKQAKIAYELELVERRLEELKILVERKVAEEKNVQHNFDLFVSHIERIEQNLEGSDYEHVESDPEYTETDKKEKVFVETSSGIRVRNKKTQDAIEGYHEVVMKVPELAVLYEKEISITLPRLHNDEEGEKEDNVLREEGDVNKDEKPKNSESRDVAEKEDGNENSVEIEVEMPNKKEDEPSEPKEQEGGGEAIIEVPVDVQSDESKSPVTDIPLEELSL